MQPTFRSFEEYHRQADRVRAVSQSWTGVRAVDINEVDGEFSIAAAERNGLVLTMDGSAAHLTRMDRILDETPSHPGEVCLVPAGVDVHLSWRNDGGTQRSLMVEFDNDLFSIYAPEITTDAFLRGHLVPANFTARPVLGSMVSMLCAEIDESTRRGRLFAETAIRLLALEVANSAWSVQPNLQRGASAADPRVDRALDYIEANFTRDISILDIAAAAGQSPTQLNLAFRAALGTSPYSLVIDRRLKLAAQLLRKTQTPIAIIAVEAGFSDQPHLNRMCRARLGTTPSLIRKG